MIFAVLAGTVLFGLLGTFLAVPVAAVIGVLVRFAAQRVSGEQAVRGPSSTEPSP